MALGAPGLPSPPGAGPGDGRFLGFEVMAPWLVDPAGEQIRTPVPVWQVIRRTEPAPTLISAVPGTPFTITPAALSHIINRHSDSARAQTLARIAAGQSQPAKFQNVGYFFPQHSSPNAVLELISDVYNAAGAADIGPGRGPGGIAAIVGALYMQETRTKVTVPLPVGLNGLHGQPTNQVALFVASDNSVITMYPVGQIRPYVP